MLNTIPFWTFPSFRYIGLHRNAPTLNAHVYIKTEKRVKICCHLGCLCSVVAERKWQSLCPTWSIASGAPPLIKAW